MQAKGIVRKRPKKDKTPRVKKRNQFNKMEKAHKTKVQEFKAGSSGVHSGLETQGLRAGIKKSTKLN